MRMRTRLPESLAMAEVTSTTQQQQALPQQQKSLQYSVFQKNMAMMTKVLETSYLTLATSAYSARLIGSDLLKGVTTKNLTTTPSERMLMLLMEVHTRITDAKDHKEARATIMTTFLDIVKLDAAHKFMAERIGKHYVFWQAAVVLLH